MKDIENNVIHFETSIFDTLKTIQNSVVKIIFIVNDDKSVIGTVTDGDVRRGILKGIVLEKNVEKVMNRDFLFIESGTPVSNEIKVALKEGMVIPELDKEGHLVEVHTEILENDKNVVTNKVFILAGGFGKRLGDLTKVTPKPMLEVGGRPILQRILEGLKEHGFEKVFISVNYQSHVIEDFFGDGSKFGLDIEYVKEDKPLGTAGSLSLVKEKVSEPLLVMNGDLLTNVDYTCFVNYFRECNSDALVSVREYDFKVPFGVVKTEDYSVVEIEEKPVKKFMVNAGVYLISPKCLDLVKSDEVLNMPSLLERILKSGNSISAFPISEYWLDIGRTDDFEKANREIGLISKK